MNTKTSAKRFYDSASVETSENVDRWLVCLDGRAISTPLKHRLELPTRALAQAIAEEWQSQTDVIDLPALTLTRLANVAMDRTPVVRAEMIAEISRYAETDVTCYLSAENSELRARQDEAWRVWRGWAGRNLDVVLVPVEGIVAAPQPAASLNAVSAYAEGLDDYRLTGLSWACSLFGSAVLSLAVDQQALDATTAMNLSCIDEDWQAETWGADDEALQARAARNRDALSLKTWRDALSS